MVQKVETVIIYALSKLVVKGMREMGCRQGRNVEYEITFVGTGYKLVRNRNGEAGE